MSFFTCFWLFPQNEHFSRSPPSPIRATGCHPPVRPAWCRWWSLPSAAGSLRDLWALRRVFAGVSSGVLRPYLLGAPLTGPHTRTLPLARLQWETTRRDPSGERGHPDARRQDRVDQAIVHRLFRGQDLVALDVTAHHARVLAGGIGDHLLEQLAHADDLVGLDLQVGDLSAGALGVGLVDQDPAVGQGEALARRTG